jgi:cytosolic iron-sulfur protein assembly protein CIAO1
MRQSDVDGVLIRQKKNTLSASTSEIRFLINYHILKRRITTRYPTASLTTLTLSRREKYLSFTNTPPAREARALSHTDHDPQGSRRGSGARILLSVFPYTPPPFLTSTAARPPMATTSSADMTTEPSPPLPKTVTLTALAPLRPALYERAWTSTPHPTLPLLATAHHKAATVFSLATLSAHSTLAGGHTRSVRSVAWKPHLGPGRLCLVSGSFDSTAGLWRWEGGGEGGGEGVEDEAGLEVEVTRNTGKKARGAGGARFSDDEDDDDEGGGGGTDKEWEFTLVLEGHDSEIKSVAFSPGGQYLATCSRDKSVWIWEDVGATEADDEWETVAVLTEHEGDVKAVAWCPDLPGRTGRRGRYGSDVLASASYDNTVRVWREDGDGEWVCVAVLEGHEGTVWGVQWEPRPRADRFPRLLTWSADRTIRVWTLQEEEEEEDAQTAQQQQNPWSGALGGIPNTMRRSLKEEWTCTATLPHAHTRDVYSVSWSAASGLVASTGSDGVVVLYGEDEETKNEGEGGDGPTGAADGDDVQMTNGQGEEALEESRGAWRVLTRLPNAHGPYEVNHVTWCRRYDAGCPAERRGVEEMLITTGDDGVVRPWAVAQGSSAP